MARPLRPEVPELKIWERKVDLLMFRLWTPTFGIGSNRKSDVWSRRCIFFKNYFFPLH
jgi:hypothetical protein